MKKLILLFLVVIGTTTVNAQLNNIAKLPTTTSVDTSHLIALGYTDTLGKRHAYGASVEKLFKAANDSGLIKTIYNADDTVTSNRTIELDSSFLKIVDIANAGELSLAPGAGSTTIISLLGGKYYIRLGSAPSAANDTGTAGEIRITTTYIYVCVATDTWLRTALVTWP